MGQDWVLDAKPPNRGAHPNSGLSTALCPQVRMAILRIIGQLALSGYQDRIKGWGLKYVSVQLTLSTYKLVSDPDMQTMVLQVLGRGFQSVEERICLLHLCLNPHESTSMTRVPTCTASCR